VLSDESKRDFREEFTRTELDRLIGRFICLYTREPAEEWKHSTDEMMAVLQEAQEANRLRAENERLSDQKDGAYRERDALVCALSKLFPAWIGRHPESDTSWDDDWRWIVFVDAPSGQMSWHIHDSERSMFDHLEWIEDDEHKWDGHTTEEKYRRLENIDAE